MAGYYISLKELFEILLKIMIDRIAGIKIDINRHRLLLFSIYLDILFTRDDAVNIDTQWTIWIYTSIFQIIITTRLALLLSRFVMNHFDAVWDKVGCKILLKILLASFLTVKSVIQIHLQLLSIIEIYTMKENNSRIFSSKFYYTDGTSLDFNLK